MSEDMPEVLSERMSNERMSEDMPERMSEDMPEKWQKECPKICQKENQNSVSIRAINVVRLKCHGGDHSE